MRGYQQGHGLVLISEEEDDFCSRILNRVEGRSREPGQQEVALIRYYTYTEIQQTLPLRDISTDHKVTQDGF